MARDGLDLLANHCGAILAPGGDSCPSLLFEGSDYAGLSQWQQFLGFKPALHGLGVG